MKKEYQQPNMRIVMLKTQHLLSGSYNNPPIQTLNSGGVFPGGIKASDGTEKSISRSRDYDWEDDDW